MEIKRPESKQPIPQSAKQVFKGGIFDVYQWQQKMFDGSVETFERLKRPDTVVVFPVLPDGRIILADEEQPGRPPFFGPIGGRVDEGEGTLEAARRELLEESGYEAEEFILWSAQHPVGKIDWVVYNFIAKGLKKVSEQNLDPGEKITLKPITFEEFVNLGVSDKFAEPHIVVKFLEAKLYPEKMEELKKLFSPK